MSRMNPLLLMAMMMAENKMRNREKVALTPEEEEKLKQRRERYRIFATKGDRNLKAIEEARKRNGLPPLELGGK